MATSAKPGTAINRVEFAALFGISLPTVDAWIRHGCPFLQRGSKGREWKFDSAAVIEWYRQREVDNAVGDVSGVDFEEARRRKTAAEAALAEYELAEKRRRLVAIEDIAEIVANEYAVCRARLLTVPQRLASRLAPVTSAAEIHDAIRDEINEALSELVSDGNPIDDSARGSGVADGDAVPGEAAELPSGAADRSGAMGRPGTPA